MKSLVEMLYLFDTEGEEFQKLVSDLTRVELDPITNINDINDGALANALQWHWRFALRAGNEFDLRNAGGALLDEWALFWGIDRPVGMSDSAFSIYIMSRILGTNISFAKLRQTYTGVAPTPLVIECYTIGPFADVSFMDLGPQKGTPYGGVLTHRNNALYLVFDTIGDFDPSVSRSSTFLKAAGIAVFTGIWDHT